MNKRYRSQLIGAIIMVVLVISLLILHIVTYPPSTTIIVVKVVGGLTVLGILMWLSPPPDWSP